MISLVTGGVSGIGRAIVEKLLERGDQVIIFDYLDENSHLKLPAKAKYFQVDISSVESINSGFNKLFNSLPDGARLDVLVNNAGVASDSLAIRLSEDMWDKVLNTNLKEGLV